MKKKILTLLVLLMTAVTGAWAQGSDPDPIELTSTDGKTWTLAATPAYDVELEVEYETELALSELDDNTDILKEWDGYEADITLTRTLQAGGWNTFAIPFSVSPVNYTTLQQLVSAQGGSIKVKELSSSSLSDGTLSLSFVDATKIEAGKPYLIKVSKGFDLAMLPAAIDAYLLANQLPVANPFKNVMVSKTAVPVSTDAVIFVPTLGKTLVTGPAGNESNADAVLFFSGGNSLSYPTVVNDTENENSYMKGFRAYFQLQPAVASTKIRAYSFNLDDEETGIMSIETRQMNNNATYDLQGRRIEGKPTQKGVYIMNGQKVIIK